MHVHMGELCMCIPHVSTGACVYTLAFEQDLSRNNTYVKNMAVENIGGLLSKLPIHRNRFRKGPAIWSVSVFVCARFTDEG